MWTYLHNFNNFNSSCNLINMTWDKPSNFPCRLWKRNWGVAIISLITSASWIAFILESKLIAIFLSPPNNLTAAFTLVHCCLSFSLAYFIINLLPHNKITRRVILLYVYICSLSIFRISLYSKTIVPTSSIYAQDMLQIVKYKLPL